MAGTTWKRSSALTYARLSLGANQRNVAEHVLEILEEMERPCCWWYRTGTTMHCVVSESGENVFLEMEQEFGIVNATQRTLCFEPTMEFERAEHPLLRRVICFDDPEYGKEAELKADPKEPNALAYHGKLLKIEPGGKRRFKYEYRIQYPIASGVFSLHFKYPTIGFSLTVKSPETLEITASPAKLECPGEWRYDDQLFMPGDHTEIRWNKVQISN